MLGDIPPGLDLSGNQIEFIIGACIAVSICTYVVLRLSEDSIRSLISLVINRKEKHENV